MSFMAGYMLGLADSREPVLTDISVAENGELTRGYSKDTLKKTLHAKLLPEKTPKEKSQDKQSKEGTKSEKLGLFNKNKKG